MAEPLVVAADWTIAEAAERQQQLLKVLEAQFEDLAVDTSTITSIDSSGLQLMLALRASLRERGLSLWLLQPSEALLSACATYGLQAELLGE
ncbi:MAG: STAS domain-containing protein [Burkholderiales bacterium]|uniref:STAS domain-containing protein n=1 Tax=Inhella sp. TaxID=1921806 RepID=UPI001ACF64B8|nr:STAS domain-containing protein [Burkholderiales bacterium]